MSQTSTYGAGASGKEAKAGRADFSRPADHEGAGQDHPLLCDHCASGDILKKVYIVYDKPVGDEQQDYFRIYLKDALITSVQLSGSNENPTESVSFAFQAVEIAYRPKRTTERWMRAVPKGYDLETLKPGFAAPEALAA